MADLSLKDFKIKIQWIKFPIKASFFKLHNLSVIKLRLILQALNGNEKRDERNRKMQLILSENQNAMRAENGKKRMAI